jgi:hypothetical protein
MWQFFTIIFCHILHISYFAPNIEPFVMGTVESALLVQSHAFMVDYFYQLMVESSGNNLLPETWN